MSAITIVEILEHIRNSVRNNTTRMFRSFDLHRLMHKMVNTKLYKYTLKEEAKCQKERLVTIVRTRAKKNNVGPK